VSLAGRLFQAAPGAPNPSNTLWLREAFFGAGSQAGKTVTVDSALRFDVVWACIRFRAFGVGQLPLIVYERLGDEERQRARNVPAARLLRRPNPEHVQMNAWGLVSTHINSWGNAYIGKKFWPDGTVRSLWPIHPQLVRVAREGGVKLFYLRDAETFVEDPEPFTAAEIIHVMGFSLDGLVGLSPIGYARESIGAGLAMDEFANKLWSNGGIPSGFLSTDQELSDETIKRLERRWNRRHRGSFNARRTAILEAGMKYNTVALPPDDAQFLGTQELSVRKICRWFNVSPSMVFGTNGDSLTYKTVEGEALRFLVFELNPELVLIEQTLEWDPDLFPRRPGDVESRWFPEFLADAMLRADTLNRGRSYALSLGGRAWQLPSEVRRREGLAPDPRLDDPTFNPPRGVSLGGGGEGGGSSQ